MQEEEAVKIDEEMVNDAIQELVEKFRNTYPERHTLMEELALF